MFAAAFLRPLISYHIDLEYDDGGNNHEGYDVGSGGYDEEDANVCRLPLLRLVSYHSDE